MTREADPPRNWQDIDTAPAKDDVPKVRACLVCGTDFLSDGFSQRICKRCKSRNMWSGVSGARMPHSRK
jgi:hypothetical protein